MLGSEDAVTEDVFPKFKVQKGHGLEPLDRKVMQPSSLRQHALCTVHRVAAEAFLSPDKPVSQCLPYSLEDQSLFKGNVPQPLDWLRAWRACRTPSSFQAALKYFGTEDFAAGQRPGLRRHSRLLQQ